VATTSTMPALQLGPKNNGMLLNAEEFDAADFERGPRYELIHGVLIVSPAPSRGERDPNGELEYLLRSYQEHHPQGGALDLTLWEENIRTEEERRRADRVIWAGLGRLPTDDDPPTIAVEFVSSGRRNRERDYEEKRREYMKLGVREYWIIDRFERKLTVYTRSGRKQTKRVIPGDATYTTPLLPGFELPLPRLLELATRWEE
jgi:Uma2 family endonuclease